jgi:Zn-dependent protease
MSGELSLSGILIIIGVLLVSMSVHEAMHAFVGLKLGDDTAAEEGRVSLNPLKHIDPFMTVILPAITLIVFHAPILAAKPVPFNPDRVKYDEFGAAMIAAAGPLSNLLLAVIAVIIARLSGIDLDSGGLSAGNILTTFIWLNVSLFVFNLIPIPPLDGSRVLYAFAPEPLQDFMRQIEPYGFFIIIGLVLVGGFGSFITQLNAAVLNFLL